MPNIIAHKGLPFALSLYAIGGIPVRYTEAKFQARDLADETSDALLSATHADGITITPSEVLASPVLDDRGAVMIAAGTTVGRIDISIGATQTELLPVTNRARTVKGQVRLYDPTNDDDTMGGPPFDVVLSPETIDD